MKFDVTKCAEIFRYGPSKYMFSCAYCIEDFNSLSNALAHIEHHFPLDAIKSTEANGKHKDDDQITNTPVESETTFVENKIFLKIEPNLQLTDSLDNPNIDETTNNGTGHTRSNDVPMKQLAIKTRRSKYPMMSRWGPPDNKSVVQCDICKSHMRKEDIYRHIQSHANLKQFVCDQCQRGFNTKSQLKRHIDTHSNFKKFNCDYCGWQFHDRANLDVHIRRHTGEKPYKCSICNRSFAQSSAMVIHIRSHTGEKPFPCTICNRSFIARNSLNRHLLTHLDKPTLQCKFCERSFYSPSTLRDHKRAVHTGERPYTCGVCNTSFSRHNSYSQHIILHTGKKPHKCRFCEMTFAQFAGRRSHERSVHKDNEKTMYERLIVTMQD